MCVCVCMHVHPEKHYEVLSILYTYGEIQSSRPVRFHTRYKLFQSGSGNHSDCSQTKTTGLPTLRTRADQATLAD